MSSSVLRVDGLVANCLELAPADLKQLPQHGFVDDFACLEGWTVPGVKWEGVLLKIVLSLARPAPEATYIQASAGDFCMFLPIDRTGQVLLAIRLHDEPVPVEHGGPIRLVVPGGQCFMQIKWLDHLELRKQPGINMAERIALGRLGAQKTPSALTST